MKSPTGKDPVVDTFSRYAESYGHYSIVQQAVARELIIPIESFGAHVVDIGCGEGMLWRTIDANTKAGIERYLATDKSAAMLSAHPDEPCIEKRPLDFNDIEALVSLARKGRFETLLSSSALQWSIDPQETFRALATLAHQAHIAVFTSGTFASLHRALGVQSPIADAPLFASIFEKYYDGNVVLKRYRLRFDSAEEALRYIKKSGVSGGVKRANIAALRRWIRDTETPALEFEVLFMRGDSRLL